MWGFLIKIQQFIQRIRPLRIQYAVEMGGFYESVTLKRKLGSLVIDTNLLLIWIASIIGLKSSLTESDPTRTVQQQILSMVLQVLFVGLFSLFLAAVWTFQFRGTNTVWLMNQAKAFHNKREWVKGSMTMQVEDQQGAKKKDIGLFDFLLYGVVELFIAGSFTIGMAPILSSHTPAHKILHAILPAGTLDQWNKPFITMICCTYLGIFGTFGMVSVLQILSYMCGVLYESQFILQRTYTQKKMGFRYRSDFTKNKLVYMQSFMFFEQYNAFGYVYFPVVMTTGFCINVVTSLICIEFHSELHPMLVACFAGFDFVCAGLTVGIHAVSMISSEEAEKFQKFWNSRLFTKFQRKDFQACMPIICEIGPFFVLRRSTFLNTISEIVKAIVSLLIMEE